MVLSVHQPQYLPWLGFFDKIVKSDCFVFLDTVQYKAREFQNRNKIRTPQGWQWLTVPVLSKGKSRQKICEVMIDNSFPWQKKHWRALNIYYHQAPYFKDYADFFESIYKKNWERLIDLNVEIIKYLLSVLEIKTPVYFESEIGTDLTGTDRIIQICKKKNADVYLSGIGAKAYLEEEKFNQTGIKLIYQNFIHPKYRQCFCKDEDSFIPYLSIIDLIFNEGKNSINILKIKNV